jgi:hypothetical protein
MKHHLKVLKWGLRSLILGAMVALQTAHAVDVGIFTLNGFAKVEAVRASNQCVNCQTFPNEDRQRPWADAIASGVSYGNHDSTLTLFQPYLGTQNFDLGEGFKVKGLLSQRWRGGQVDIPGVLYEKNAILTHEDYGMLQVGAFPTRSWSWADYPYGTILGLADPWASSGAGYGLLTNAVRYGTPLMDVFEGDLYLEFTYDSGSSNWRANKPALYEAVARYVKGPWMVDAIAQSADNGQAMSWGHGPFLASTTAPAFAGLAANRVQGNHQSILMFMARYQWDVKTDLYAGLRFNSWSGSPGTIIGETTPGSGVYLWNNMFNVSTGNIGQAYPAKSTDFNFGAVYRFMPQWSIRAAAMHFGTASTSNPTERGQSNSMWLATAGLGYDVQPGFTLYGFAGLAEFARQGLAPLSMPANTAFTGIDPRVSKTGNWVGLGAVYVF